MTRRYWLKPERFNNKKGKQTMDTVCDFAKVERHWAKEILRRHSIPLGVTARSLGITYQYCCLILGGHCKATDAINAKLRTLCDGLESEK